MKTIKFLLAILVSIAIAACGGGGDSAAPTYKISGTVTGASSVALNLAGTSTASTTTDVSGNYSFTGLRNGSYTVTPSLTGYAFSPTGAAVNVSGANITGTDFVATVAATTYSISGTVSGATSADVTITLSGDNTGSTMTGVGGTYTIAGLVAGNYTVTPTKAGYTFSPTNIAITGLAADSLANDFVATAVPLPHSISGTVSGDTMSGVTIDVTGTATASTTTAANGSYTVTGLYDGSYTVTPSKTGYTFNPISTSVTMSGANVTGKNFVSTANVAPTYTLSGTITGPWVEGVTITMSGAGSATTTTNASGNYSFANLLAGTYTLTPSLAGYTYSPAAPAVPVSANTTQNFTATSAITSYSISGTVTYPVGTNSGPIAILVYSSSCSGCSTVGGTVIAAPGAYTVRGLQTGNSYVVMAEMDALGTAIPNANNPLGTSATTPIAGADVTGVNIVVADPTIPAPVAPTIQGVAPANGSAFIQYSSPKDANGQEIATSYKIYWGTDNTALTGGGTATFTAQGDRQNLYVLGGLTDTSALYFKMSAFVGATESALSAATGPVTIGATTGSHTVSGNVTFLGTATGPLVVGVYSNAGIYFTRIASPVSPQSYSVAGVTTGTYQVFAVLDMNNNGVIDLGDITNVNGNLPSITVNANKTSNITLSSASATASVNTDHWYDGSTHNYSLNLGINDGIKHAVAVTLISGPNVAVPFDMGVDPNSNSMNVSLGTTLPTLGDAYTFRVTYSDATTQDISGSVTGVLGMGALAQSLATMTDGTGGSSTTVPLFTWTAPSSPPLAPYTYRLNLNGINDSISWYYPRDNGLPSTTLSALYNADSNASSTNLTSGNTYNWQVQVQDANRNSATLQTTYLVP